MRAKKTSIEIPRKSPGSVNGRKKRRDIGPRSREDSAQAVRSRCCEQQGDRCGHGGDDRGVLQRLAKLERREDVAVPAQGEPLERERERPGLVEGEEHDDDEGYEEEHERESENRRRERAPLRRRRRSHLDEANAVELEDPEAGRGQRKQSTNAASIRNDIAAPSGSCRGPSAPPGCDGPAWRRSCLRGTAASRSRTPRARRRRETT